MLLAFDLDGTLVDSRRDLADATNELITEYGGEPFEELAVGRMIGDGAAVLVARAFAAIGIAATPPGALDRFLVLYERRMLLHTCLYPGIPEALRTLARAARLAVLTNKPGKSADHMLRYFGLAPLFADVVSGDGALPRKPAPAGLRYLMTRAGVGPDDTLLIGDSLVDFETAGHAGVRVALARYGFGFLQFPLERLRGDELWLDQPADLVPLIERLQAAGPLGHLAR
jgi:phosphoglycolate phosphatase